MKSRIYLIVLIFFLTFFLRLYKLGEIPSGFYSDEALYGYEAYSLIKTGKDQYGHSYPLIFKAFGDHRPGLFIYATMPFIAVLGLNEFSTRLPSAIFSTATVVVIFFLGLELWRSYRASLLSSLLFAISPWSLQFARMSHETNLATFLVVLSIYLFLKGLKRGWYMTLSFVIFSLSLYSYYTTRIFILYFFILIVVFRNKLIDKIKYAVLGLLSALSLFMPFLRLVLNKEIGWSRVEAISIWGDTGWIDNINQFIGEDLLLDKPLAYVFHNKLVDGGITFAKSFFSHFDPQFLFFNGDPINIYHTINTGILFFSEGVFVIVAIFILLKRTSLIRSLLLAWFIIGLLPDTLTRLAPAAARIHLILPEVCLLGGLGIKQIKRRFPLILLGVMTIFQMVYFLHQNFVHSPIRYAQDWHYGLRAVVSEIEKLDKQNQYDYIWISRSGWGWINYLFYLKYPPEKIQKEIFLSQKNEFGLSWVEKFDKYIFNDFPYDLSSQKETLFIGAPYDFYTLEVKKPLAKIYYPNGNTAFILADSTSF